MGDFSLKMRGTCEYKSRAWLPGTGLPLSEGAGLGRGEGRREDERELGFPWSTTCWYILKIFKGNKMESNWKSSVLDFFQHLLLLLQPCKLLSTLWAVTIRIEKLNAAHCETEQHVGLCPVITQITLFTAHITQITIYCSFQASPRLP